MKANEAPEKIYLQENTTTDCYGEFWPEWFEARAKDSDIEYTRADAFIEKAQLFLIDKLKEIPMGRGKMKIKAECSLDEFIEDFKNYMEGE